MALVCDVLIVEVHELATGASPELRRAAECERAILADRPATRVYRTCLGRTVELELAIGDDGTDATEHVVEDALLEGAGEAAIASLLL